MEFKIAGNRLSRLLHGEDILRKLISTFECFEFAAEFPSSQSSSREFGEKLCSLDEWLLQAHSERQIFSQSI